MYSEDIRNGISIVFEEDIIKSDEEIYCNGRLGFVGFVVWFD